MFKICYMVYYELQGDYVLLKSLIDLSCIAFNVPLCNLARINVVVCLSEVILLTIKGIFYNINENVYIIYLKIK